MTAFEVRVPKDKLIELREKLEREQRHKAAQDQVRYSVLHNTFWRWTHTPRGWSQQKCSRNGKRTGEFFNGFKREVVFERFANGRAGYRINPPREPCRLTFPILTQPAVDLPGFLPVRADWSVDHLLTIVGTKTGRWSSGESPPLEQLEKTTMMSALKLSILLWRAAHATEGYSAPIGYGHGVLLTAKAELTRDGLIEVAASGGYRLTDKGGVFVAHLLAQPLPVAAKPKWEMPASDGQTKPSWVR